MKTPESREKFAQKILEKNSFQWGIYRPQKNIAVGSRNCQKCSTGRPAGRPSNGQILPVGSYRSTARVDRNKQRALLSDPVDPDGRPSLCLPNVHSSVHVGRPHGRPALGAVDRAVDRPGLSASSGSETLVKNILINLLSLLKIPKNSFIILH